MKQTHYQIVALWKVLIDLKVMMQMIPQRDYYFAKFVVIEKLLIDLKVMIQMILQRKLSQFDHFAKLVAFAHLKRSSLVG